MCGIIGLFGGSYEQAEEGLEAIKHRGRDERRVQQVEGGYFGHALHAVTGYRQQPAQGAGTLLFNGQIYNWRALAKQEGVSAKSDTDVLLHLLDTGIDWGEQRKRLDGVYAYAYLRDDTVVLERDVLGVKPLFYACADDAFCFASEPKAIRAMGYRPRELHPRTTLEYDVSAHELHTSTRPLEFGPGTDLDDALVNAVRKRIPEDGKVGVLFSGGLDSGLVAHLAVRAGADVTLYVSALDDPAKKTPHDLAAAREAADALGLELVEVTASLEEVEQALPEVCSLVEDSNVVKVGVALPFLFACRQAAADGQRVLLSGLGAEEVFAGYNRHKNSVDVNQECVRGLRAMHERDLFRDDVVAMSQTLELRLPLLDYAVVSTGLAIPGDQKIVDGVSKVPLREAATRLGLPAGIADRKKKAAQYGSQFDAAIEKLAPGYKSEYLREIYPVNARLCALLSSGKDSVYALHTMQRMNYAVACCATIFSENPDSYMFHTPAVGFARLQAQAMGLPLLEQSTAGDKEDELADLKAVLVRAVEEFGVDGVVSGALFSDYQRSRIERVCEELGLQVFAPLWHLDQEMEVREVLDAGFEFVLSKVAAEGLDRSWVGRVLSHDDVDVLSQKLGLNVAGEGGEYESLVLDGPNFRKRIVLEDAEVVCDAENGSVEVCILRASGRLE